jgi:penicillin-binding protein 1A
MEEAHSDTAPSSFAYRLRRDAGGLFGRLRPLWGRRLFRWGAIAFGAMLVGLGLFWLIFARGLPDAATLLEYEPPLPTIVRDINGQPVHSYARERRVQLQYSDYPQQLIHAYLAAEDKTFFEHHGVDIPGFAGAVVDYASKLGSGQRARGGSTITQQVAKNLLIGDEYSPTRKVKEMILAYRMENVLSKQQILELYLNQIFLGRNAYGVQAAARAYFDKDVADLQLHEMAYLSILPKGPANYRPESETGHARALDRRNWALGEMVKSGWITTAQRNAAAALPLGTVAAHGSSFDARAGGYYMEEVRRRLIQRFGEKAEDGPNSVYAGGLWVRSPYDPVVQDGVATALRNGLLRFDAGRGWSGPIAHLDIDNGWEKVLAASYIDVDYAQWRVAVIISRTSSDAQIGFADGSTGTLPASAANTPYRKTGGPAFSAMKPGDLIVVARNGSSWALRNIPEVSGGMVAQDVHSGRIRAMQGGFDSRLSSYNRATQALRQPGSTIKPFVYAAALDNGMTPASIIVDGPLCVYQGAGLGQKCFRNFSGGSAGPQTMRWGVEQSRNLMTVRAASQTGMDRVVRTIKALGIGDYKPYLSFALGAGETTVERMVNAYATLANQGRQFPSKVMDYVQDRRGKVIWPERWRPCEHGELGWQGDAPLRYGGQAGHEPHDRLSGCPHHRRRGPARHRNGSGRPSTTPVRQDRYHQWPDQRLVRGWIARYRRGCLYRLRPATQPGRLGAGRPHRRADLEGGDGARSGNHAKDALRCPCGYSHGRDRPAIGQARLWRLADQRAKSRRDLGSVQARIRTPPHHPQGRGGGAGKGRRVSCRIRPTPPTQ